MNPNEIREVVAEIGSELDRLDQLRQEIEQFSISAENQKSLEKVFDRSFALQLHNFYTGCERIFGIIAIKIDVFLPSESDWYKRLFLRMAVDHDDRPAAISTSTAKALEEYLAFRHVVRNIYCYELEHDRVTKLLQQFDDTFNQFRTDLQNFVKWLDDLADQLTI